MSLLAILQKIMFICDMGIVQNYLGNWGKRVNFGNGVAKILTKVWREKISDVTGGGRKNLNFGNLITEILAAQYSTR